MVLVEIDTEETQLVQQDLCLSKTLIPQEEAVMLWQHLRLAYTQEGAIKVLEDKIMSKMEAIIKTMVNNMFMIDIEEEMIIIPKQLINKLTKIMAFKIVVIKDYMPNEKKILIYIKTFYKF